MKCPECYSPEHRVLSTRTRECGIIDRSRKCSSCGHRFKTSELPPGAYGYAKSDIAKWERRQIGEHNTKIRSRKKLQQVLISERKNGKKAKELADRFGLSVHMVWYYTKPSNANRQ